MHRMLRALVSLNIFTLDATTGRFRNNRLSSALRTDITGSARAIAAYFGTRAHALAWADAEETIRTGRNAFERVHGMAVWDWAVATGEFATLSATRAMKKLQVADLKIDETAKEPVLTLEKAGRDQGGGFDPYNGLGSGKRVGEAATRQGITGSKDRDRSAALDRLYGKKK